MTPAGSGRPRIKALFLDIGGVLLTNGWDRDARRRAAVEFDLDLEELNERHHLSFDTYEQGKLSLDEYLRRVVFHRQRLFAPGDFKAFMFAQSRAVPEMIALVRGLKARHGLRLVAVSNEGRELTVHRIGRFALGELLDFFIASCFVHFRKPDADIFRIALDLAQVEPAEVLYIEDRALYVEVAGEMGIRGIVHRGYGPTRAALAELGLEP